MEKISYYIWILATIMLISCGLFYTIRLKFPQFRFKKIIKSIKDNSNTSEEIV